jgi:hypothetical protein
MEQSVTCVLARRGGFEKTAQEPVGFCRGAATDHSPGLQPWVSPIETRALKMAPDVGAIGGVNAPFPEHSPRSPLSGRFRPLPNPGLKPWAILSGQFMAKSPTS